MSLPTSFHTMIIRRLKGGLIKIIGASLAIKAKKTPQSGWRYWEGHCLIEWGIIFSEELQALNFSDRPHFLKIKTESFLHYLSLGVLSVAYTISTSQLLLNILFKDIYLIHLRTSFYFLFKFFFSKICHCFLLSLCCFKSSVHRKESTAPRWFVKNKSILKIVMLILELRIAS